MHKATEGVWKTGAPPPPRSGWGDRGDAIRWLICRARSGPHRLGVRGLSASSPGASGRRGRGHRYRSCWPFAGRWNASNMHQSSAWARCSCSLGPNKMGAGWWSTIMAGLVLPSPPSRAGIRVVIPGFECGLARGLGGGRDERGSGSASLGRTRFMVACLVFEAVRYRATWRPRAARGGFKGAQGRRCSRREGEIHARRPLATHLLQRDGLSKGTQGAVLGRAGRVRRRPSSTGPKLVIVAMDSRGPCRFAPAGRNKAEMVRVGGSQFRADSPRPHISLFGLAAAGSCGAAEGRERTGFP